MISLLAPKAPISFISLPSTLPHKKKELKSSQALLKRNTDTDRWPLKYEALQAHSNVQELWVPKWRTDPLQIIPLELE